MDIQSSLQKYFEQFRIIFWYDADSEMKQDFESIELPEVTKVVVQNNEFGIKHRIMREETDRKFLLYFAHEVPPKQENWLLDILLANHQFHTTKEAIYMQDIGMDYIYKDFVSAHLPFFAKKENRARFTAHFSDSDNESMHIQNMLAVLFKTEAVRIEEFLLAYLFIYEKKKDDILNDLNRYNLLSDFWKLVQHQYGYISEEPSLYGFVLELFKTNHTLSSKGSLTRESKILMDRWKRDSQGIESFTYFSKRVAEDLKISEKLKSEELSVILHDDLYEEVDKHIITYLRDGLMEKKIPHEKVVEIIKSREIKRFYLEKPEFYLAVLYASQLIEEVTILKELVNFNEFSEGIKTYTQTLYRVDYAYRKFLENYRKTNQNSGFTAIKELVHSTYSNNWLLKQSNRWQNLIDHEDSWNKNNTKRQSKFYEQQVEPLLKKGQKICVIISDAFRYEVGVELNERLEKEKRFVSQLDYLVTGLPSCTAVGMAALLPHKTLQITENYTVECDGMSSVGMDNRDKILKANSSYPAVALSASQLLKMSTKDGREFRRPYDLMYIYHDQIDATGHDTKTEDGNIEACTQAVEELISVMRKLYNMNCWTFLVTADHGFIYQAEKLHETDFTEFNKSGVVWKTDRRFVIGTGLQGDSSNHHYRAEQLSQIGDAEVLIPKSINRLRKSGSCSQFVHGGATFQEIVVPLLKVTVKKEDTVQKVDIEILRNADRVTSNLIPVSFLQKQLVDSKNLGRTIRAKFWDEDKTIELSDEFLYTFDVEEGVERQREIKKLFNLSASASSLFNNKRIYLILEEPIEDTNEWKEYARFGYTVMLTVANDFDDWD